MSYFVNGCEITKEHDRNPENPRRALWNVYPPEGERFNDDEGGPHGRVVYSPKEARDVAENTPREACPPDCDCAPEVAS